MDLIVQAPRRMVTNHWLATSAIDLHSLSTRFSELFCNVRLNFYCKSLRHLANELERERNVNKRLSNGDYIKHPLDASASCERSGEWHVLGS